jgi:hypothetical protein
MSDQKVKVRREVPVLFNVRKPFPTMHLWETTEAPRISGGKSFAAGTKSEGFRDSPGLARDDCTGERKDSEGAGGEKPVEVGG